MPIERRNFIKTAGLASLAGFMPGMVACSSDKETRNAPGSSPSISENWETIRQSFLLDNDFIHMAGLLLASNPQPVREAISVHRRKLDENPTDYVQDHFSEFPAKVREEAASYMGVNEDEIALTDSTTTGTALLINGLHIREDQEMVSAETDYSVTHRSA